MNLLQKFKEEAAKAYAEGRCVECRQPFSEENVHTDAGWKEIRISGMCENCFDAATAEPEDLKWSILGHVPTRLTKQQIEAIRRRIEERAAAEAVIWVQEGQDLDHGRVSRLEFLASGAIVVSAEDIDALLAGDGDQADRVRERMDKYVAELTREWLETARGAEWLGQKVEESLAEEIEQETERMAEARADQLAFRQEKAD